MVTTVLELAQMNALYTISDLKQIHLHSAVNQIISDNAYLIHQKSLTISNEIPDSCDVMLSQMHLETLMGNIISNAVKYSYINGMITITAEEENDSVHCYYQGLWCWYRTICDTQEYLMSFSGQTTRGTIGNHMVLASP